MMQARKQTCSRGAVAMGVGAIRSSGGRAPPVELVDVYHGAADLSKYWASEKIRRRARLLGRPSAAHASGQRHRGHPHGSRPAGRIRRLDGELWTGYGEFSTASTIVRTADADDPEWHNISYRVFDLPDHAGDFDVRISAIREAVAAIDEPWVVAVRQFKVADDRALDAALERVLAKGGEGLVLHRGSRDYQAGRGCRVTQGQAL